MARCASLRRAHLPMPRQHRALLPALQQRVHGDGLAVFEDANLVGSGLDLEHPGTRPVGHAVVVAADADAALVADAPLGAQHRVEAAGGQRLQAGRSSARCSATIRSVVPCWRTLATVSSH